MPHKPAWNRTKVVITQGPSSKAPKIISSLIDKGVDVFRLNFSHGTLKEHTKTVKNIRSITNKKNVPVAILGDLPGPKLRIGRLKEPLILKKGDFITLTSKKSHKNPLSIPLQICPLGSKSNHRGKPYPRLIKKLSKGSFLYFKDGTIKVKVVSKNRDGLLCRICTDGQLTSRTGINIPGIPYLSKNVANAKYIEFIKKHKLDMAAVSFVSRPGDITKIRKKLKSNVLIIAKIETKTALQNIDSIIEVSDGIMVARGDLGIELPLEKIAVVQKEIIRKCNKAGKPVITATQMLESMLYNPCPTRAEVSDVSNAILDGTDSVMLSAETAIGKYPVEAVGYLTKIARVVESKKISKKKDSYSNMPLSIASAISRASCNLAEQLKAKAIITPTRTGATARLISMYRPNTMIIAPSINPCIQRQLILSRGVYPILVSETSPKRKLLQYILQKTKKIGLLKKNDLIVVTGGTEDSPLGTTNLVEIHRV